MPNDIILIVAIISPFLTIELLFKVAIVMSSDIILNFLILSSSINNNPDLFANILALPV